jgi:hypothetical protein
MAMPVGRLTRLQPTNGHANRVRWQIDEEDWVFSRGGVFIVLASVFNASVCQGFRHDHARSYGRFAKIGRMELSLMGFPSEAQPLDLNTR